MVPKVSYVSDYFYFSFISSINPFDKKKDEEEKEKYLQKQKQTVLE